MSSNKKSKKVNSVLSAIAATSCVLTIGATAELNSKEVSVSDLGTGGYVRSLLAMGRRSQYSMDDDSMMDSDEYSRDYDEMRHHEMKNGESKCGESKCGEGKCGEGKCGEGKCG